MNYKTLRLVVKHIKRNGKCPECGKKYSDAVIEVIGTNGNNAFFQLSCPTCGANTLLHTAVFHHNNESTEITHEMAHSLEEFQELVSHDDVLDMHNFLKNLDGNLEKHLKT